MIDPFQEILFASVGMFGENCGGMLGDIHLACLTCPAAHIAIGQQRKSPQFIASASVLQVGQQIVKAQLKAKECSHVATQHKAVF